MISLFCRCSSNLSTHSLLGLYACIFVNNRSRTAMCKLGMTNSIRTMVSNPYTSRNDEHPKLLLWVVRVVQSTDWNPRCQPVLWLFTIFLRILCSVLLVDSTKPFCLRVIYCGFLMHNQMCYCQFEDDLTSSVGEPNLVIMFSLRNLAMPWVVLRSYPLPILWNSRLRYQAILVAFNWQRVEWP